MTYTLFGDPNITIYRFKNSYQLDISEAFINCAQIHLTKSLESLTGLKPQRNLSISWVPKEQFFYEKGKVSRISFFLFVNHNWDYVTVCWSSKSGKVYEIHDEVIDCNDIELYFESLDAITIHQQLFPKVDLPFKLKDLTYELVVTGLNRECTLLLRLRQEQVNNGQAVAKQVSEFFHEFNESVLKKMGKKVQSITGATR